MSQKNQETHLNVLRHLEDNPNVTQRELATELGISLGKNQLLPKSADQQGPD